MLEQERAESPAGWLPDSLAEDLSPDSGRSSNDYLNIQIKQNNFLTMPLLNKGDMRGCLRSPFPFAGLALFHFPISRSNHSYEL